MFFLHWSRDKLKILEQTNLFQKWGKLHPRNFTKTTESMSEWQSECLLTI